MMCLALIKTEKRCVCKGRMAKGLPVLRVGARSFAGASLCARCASPARCREVVCGLATASARYQQRRAAAGKSHALFRILCLGRRPVRSRVRVFTTLKRRAATSTRGITARATCFEKESGYSLKSIILVIFLRVTCYFLKSARIQTLYQRSADYLLKIAVMASQCVLPLLFSRSPPLPSDVCQLKHTYKT